MIVEFFQKSGKTPPVAMYRYLLRLRNQDTDEDRAQVRLLAGDINLSKQIIHDMNFATKYTAGCLSFAEPDLPTATKYALMQDFEKTLLHGLDASRYNIVWIEHLDKGRLELNFVIANQELETGMRLQPYFDPIDRPLVDSWKQVKNEQYDLIRPQAPKGTANRARLSKKNQALKDEADALVVQAELRSRQEVIRLLQQNGFEVTRQTKNNLTVERDGCRVRLHGVYYQQSFDGQIYEIAPDITLAKQKLNHAMGVKKQFNTKKYGPSEAIGEMIQHDPLSRTARITVSSERIRNADRQTHAAEHAINRAEQQLGDAKRSVTQTITYEQTLERYRRIEQERTIAPRSDFNFNM